MATKAIRVDEDQHKALVAEWRKLAEPRISFREWFARKLAESVLK